MFIIYLKIKYNWMKIKILFPRAVILTFLLLPQNQEFLNTGLFHVSLELKFIQHQGLENHEPKH